jgi:hypothetical protein
MMSFGTNNDKLLEMLAAYPKEITFNADVFWNRILQQRPDAYFGNGLDEQSNSVLVDSTSSVILSSAMNFMSMARRRRPRLLDLCPPCRILFVGWEMVRTPTEIEESRGDTLESHAKASLTLRSPREMPKRSRNAVCRTRAPPHPASFPIITTRSGLDRATLRDNVRRRD